ncbi:hypothetical protein DCAR_0206597 [Daucus carota subsp. sativus]|uniref:Uncharacterized protein n=1 Tax=Daucus carota subsp. sativus TaxID=79200 RepID=A0A166DB14_DAUCS|nr:hypothetical protein DCAR_0206597 [Daucus carota subsp. sativus]
MREKNTIVPPGFSPILPRFGEYVSVNHSPNQDFGFENRQMMDNTPLYPQGCLYEYSVPQHIYPAYHEHVSVNQSLDQGFVFEKHQMTNNTPLYPQGFLYEYSMPPHTMTDSSASHQANAPQEERFTPENVFVVEVESPILPMSKPRLRWTPELHERFTHAAEELGGYFKAKPKAILQKMNVSGITTEQLKSHLQKVRNSILRTSSSAGGILNGQVPSTPSFESDIERHERLQMNSECLNNHCTCRIAPVNEYLANNVKFDLEDFCSLKSSRTSTYHQILKNTMLDRDDRDMKFEHFSFG